MLFGIVNSKEKEVKIKPEIYSCGYRKEICKACIMSSDGSIAEETKYNNTLDEICAFTVKKYVAVCESTANLWLKTYQAFEKYNIGASKSLKTKAIAEAKIKTDTLDARTA